jgi:hypothetical protein
MSHKYSYQVEARLIARRAQMDEDEGSIAET